VSRRRRSLRYRPESTRPSVIIISAVLGLITAVTAAGCAWLFLSLVVSLFGSGVELGDVVGRARQMPVWFALIGLPLGAAVAGQIAWDSASYLVRVIRRQPKLVMRGPDEPGRGARRSRDPRRSGDPRRRAGAPRR
jgi:hypothetical protein